MTGKGMQHVLEDAGFDVRPYSGRGMGGADCLGVEADLGDVVATVVGSAARHAAAGAPVVWLDALSDGAQSIRTDTLGLISIVYFPGVPFVGPEEKGEGGSE